MSPSVRLDDEALGDELVDGEDLDDEGPCALGGIEPEWNWCLACQAGHPEDCVTLAHDDPRWWA
jgi:hypothetical protein